MRICDSALLVSLRNADSPFKWGSSLAISRADSDAPLLRDTDALHQDAMGQDCVVWRVRAFYAEGPGEVWGYTEGEGEPHVLSPCTVRLGCMLMN